MPKSRVIAIVSLFVLSAVLTACGNNDSPEATQVPTQAAVATRETAAADVAAPTAQRVERPTVAANATPQMVQVIAASPVAVSAATPVTRTSPATMPVQVTFVLNGTEQQEYVTTADGCIGVGTWRALKPGAQVIVRDATGTVVDIATLEAGVDSQGCSWVAELSVPDSEFVNISIPMTAEMWFSQADLDSGMIEIVLP